MYTIIKGLLYPFLGTVFGSSFVFFLKKSDNKMLLAALDSIAAGIMCAASFFSLISPAISQAENQGSFSLLSCSLGFFCGILIFIIIDVIINNSSMKEKNNRGKLLIWAVTLHNIPEGMAVGVVLSGLLCDNPQVSVAGALTLSVGIALQNIPEGAIISLPVKAGGERTSVAFIKGTVSGIAELIAGIITLFLSSFVGEIMPFSLCFAAGTMIYVVLAELSVEFTKSKNRERNLFLFGAGFTLMMLLDTFLG